MSNTSPLFNCECSCFASKRGYCTALQSPVKAKDGHHMLMEECPFYKEHNEPFTPRTGKDDFKGNYHNPRADHGVFAKPKPDKFV